MGAAATCPLRPTSADNRVWHEARSVLGDQAGVFAHADTAGPVGYDPAAHQRIVAIELRQRMVGLHDRRSAAVRAGSAEAFARGGNHVDIGALPREQRLANES